MRVNGQVIKNTQFVFPTLTTNFQIVVGEETDGSQLFSGEVSLVQLFDRAFTNVDFSQMLIDCPTFSRQPQNGLVISWREYTTVDQYNFAVLVSIPGICVTSTCLPGRTDCLPEHGKTKCQSPFLFRILRQDSTNRSQLSSQSIQSEQRSPGNHELARSSIPRQQHYFEYKFQLPQRSTIHLGHLPRRLRCN